MENDVDVSVLGNTLYKARVQQEAAVAVKQQAQKDLEAAAPERWSALQWATGMVSTANAAEKAAKTELVEAVEKIAADGSFFGRSVHPQIDLKTESKLEFIFTEENVVALFKAAQAMGIVETVFNIDISFLPKDTTVNFAKLLTRPKANVDSHARWQEPEVNDDRD